MGSMSSSLDMCKATAVDTMPGFPEKLGPFAIIRTPFTGEDFRILPKRYGLPAKFPLMAEDEGTSWLLDKSNAARCGIDIGERHRLQGRFSPRHQITLPMRSRQGLKIPADARTFVWSYPVEGWGGLRGEETPAGAFLSIGGFVYLDKDYNILAANTLMAPIGLPRGLAFSDPRPWRAEWTAELVRQNRFQPVTIKAMVDRGARQFCWLRPDEYFPNVRTLPNVPHGGFVYLFHDDMDVADPLDRYFASNLYPQLGPPPVVTVVCQEGMAQRLVPFKVRDINACSATPGQPEDV